MSGDASEVAGPAGQAQPGGRGWRALRWVLAVVLVLGLFGWVFQLDVRAYLRNNPDAARRTGAGVLVKVARAAVEDLPEVIGASGEAELTTPIQLKAMVAGRVKAHKAEVGQMVAKGDPLLEIDPTLHAAHLRTVEKSLETSRAALSLREFQLEEMKKLFAQGIVSRMEMANAGLRLEANRREMIEDEEAVAIARWNLDNTVVASPVTGVVLERPVHAGESVGPGEVVLIVGDIRDLLVSVQVSEEKVRNVHLGQEAEVTLAAFPGIILRGAVAKVDPRTNPGSRTFKTWVRVEDPESKLRPGLSAYARLKSARRTLVIPKLAVVQNAGEASVFVVEGDSCARLRRIRIGAEVSGRVEVLSGLDEGQQVVCYGLIGLMDNDLVRVQALGPPAN